MILVMPMVVEEMRRQPTSLESLMMAIERRDFIFPMLLFHI